MEKAEELLEKFLETPADFFKPAQKNTSGS